MGRILQTELQKYLDAPNGPNMLRQMYHYFYHHFPAMFKDECPYEKDSVVYVHVVGSTESIVAFSMLVSWDFDINPSDIQCGHFCVYVAPKVHQVLRLIDFIEQQYPDECSEIQAYLDANAEQVKADIDAKIAEHIEKNYERVSDAQE